MAIDERSQQQLAPFLAAEEKLLYTGRCYTGFSLLFLLALMFALVGGLVYLALGRVGVVTPVRSWRLALTDRRLVLCPEDLLGRLRKPGGEQSHQYSELSKAEMGKWLIMGYLLRLWPSQGEPIEIQLPRARHNLQALQETLRQVAPQLLAG